MKRWHHRLVLALAVLLVILLVGPFLVPVPPLEGTVPPEQLADPDSRFIEVNGITIHYKMAGSGRPALILLHGFAASTFSWREVIGPLSEVGTVVAFDRPGFGLTERPMPGEWEGRSPYAPEAQADLTVGVMDALGIERAVLVGNSAGGTVALLTALTYPERAEALVLVDPAIYVRGMTPVWLRPFLNTPQMCHLGPLLARRIQDWGVDFARSAWHDPSKLTPEIWEGYAKPLRAENWDRALWEVTRASRPLGLEKRLGEVRVPVLVVTGDDDRIVPTEQSIRLAGEIPGANWRSSPNAGTSRRKNAPGRFWRPWGHFWESDETLVSGNPSAAGRK